MLATLQSRWLEAVRSVVSNPQLLEVHTQPIVSTAEAAVVGYEALSRFPVLDGIPSRPDLWFAQAERVGLRAPLEALVIRRCLQMRDDLPPNCFLSVNLSPHLLADPCITAALFTGEDLNRVVIELTENSRFDDLAVVQDFRARVAERGGLLALDDAGSGYSGLHQITTTRPHLVKLDRSLVHGLDTDETRLALVEMLGEFAGRIDAWLLVEGVQTWGEVLALARLGVPLMQGFVFAHPGLGWPGIDEQAVSRLSELTATVHRREHLGSLVEPVDSASVAQIDTDAHGRPVSLHLIGSGVRRTVAVSLRVRASDAVWDVARRVLARPEAVRFDPVVCVDGRGRAMGIVRMERLLGRLADLACVHQPSGVGPSGARPPADDLPESADQSQNGRSTSRFNAERRSRIVKQFACGDVVPGCTSVFRGESEDDILGQVGAHAAADHGLTEISPELVAAVRARIHQL
ncbi:MAG: EAL domain-containing protein [Actinomycetales bacterium]